MEQKNCVNQTLPVIVWKDSEQHVANLVVEYQYNTATILVHSNVRTEVKHTIEEALATMWKRKKRPYYYGATRWLIELSDLLGASCTLSIIDIVCNEAREHIIKIRVMLHY